MDFDVIGIENFPAVDFLLRVDTLPATNSLVTARDPSWQCGGKVATALAALGRLGARAGIIASVGDDRLGSYCIEDFKRHHVDVSRMVINRGRTTTLSTCLAEMSTEGRSFLAVFGSCGPLKPEHIPEDYIASARYIHFYQVTPATVYAAKLARKRGIKTSFDGDVYEKITEDNLDLIDILIGSEFFYVERFKDREFKNLRENCFALKRRGPEIVVITLGSRGCAGVYGDTYFESPGFPVEVVDTTGAGDVFHGAFLFGLLKGYDVEYTARFANAASAIKCTRQGGRAGIPKLAAIDRFLKDGFIDYSEIDQRVEFYKNGIWNQAAY